MNRLWLSVLLVLTSCVSMNEQHASDTSAARNVILVIGDGMDDQQITIARNYLAGASGKLLLDELPVRSAVQVLTVGEQNPAQAVYVADSANSATALATGVTTSIGRIATTALTDQDIPTIAEQAKARGMKVGIVTTASITDATPASFISHISLRGCENPDMMVDANYYGTLKIDCSADTKAKGGPGSISEQIAASSYDILLGGGREHFIPLAEGSNQTVLEKASEGGFLVIQQAGQLKNLPPDTRVLGLFADNHLPVRWRAEGDRKAEKLKGGQLDKSSGTVGEVEYPEPMDCEKDPAYGSTPSLKHMTETALQQLRGAKGFFLMLESASIDKQSHKRNACGQIGEMEQLVEALQVVLNFAADNPGTLVLVTADHGQAAQLIPDVSESADAGFPVVTPGLLARVNTPEGGIMAVNYATSKLFSEEHTGVTVPLFANSAKLVPIATMVQQQDVYTIMARYLQLLPGEVGEQPE